MLQDYATLSLSFIFLVALLYFALVMGALWANNEVDESKRWSVRWLRLGVGGFLLVTGWLAFDRFFTDFSGFPPRIMVAILIAFVGMLVIAFNRKTKKWLTELPQSWLIGVQCFRVLVEIQLFYLARTPLFPKMMTIEGSNFDIITGLTALPVAFWVAGLTRAGKGEIASKLIWAWNLMGLFLLINVAGRGLLSAPTELRAILVDPPPIAIGAFPFIWLPTFVVPFAALMHLLSLRKVSIRDESVS